ncbi:restriction endonuclease [Pseudomonas fluorescens]|uniref:Restriction endonuclease n=1 Tax=Pseudomonas fluorescens TaxID=294 RepID=A0A1T2Y2P8_PSEFL|nr:restriction endonuclease [Pseudomonas fluorescens]
MALELFRLYPVECQEKKARSKAITTDDELVSQIAREIYGSRGRWQDNYPELQSSGQNPRRIFWGGVQSANSASHQASHPVTADKVALNRILFGPPGTGKTYSTIEAALEVLDPVFLAKQLRDSASEDELRIALKARVDELDREGRIRFVTFHQSFSYEDFIEGLRAVSDEKGLLSYPIEPGIFKLLCDQARTSSADAGVAGNPRIWKISIKGTGASPELTYCLDHGEARIGWVGAGDMKAEKTTDFYDQLGSNDKSTLSSFAKEIQSGDILVCIHSAELISAIGVVTGEYRHEASPPSTVRLYPHVLPVNWLYRDLNLSVLPLNGEKSFTQKTVYPLDRFNWSDLLSYLHKSDAKPIKPFEQADGVRKPHVLVIDEINRGNISRIFGELISLIEPSKRERLDAASSEGLSVRLPYSKLPFSVPDNVYLIGTMNTADRSLASMDIALRRRFNFIEMPPKPDLLEGIFVNDGDEATSEAGVDIKQLLTSLNERIEVLLDRDHSLGHAYFLPLRDEPSLALLASIFRQQILPLLQEYFFEDWQRIHWVLNDHNKEYADQFVQEVKIDFMQLFGAKGPVDSHAQRWKLNENAFDRIQTYFAISGNIR